MITAVAAIDQADALAESELDRLLDPASLPAERGWCWLPDGVGYVASRVEMPGVTGEMIDWWFDWHPDDPDRYRLWHPGHQDIAIERPTEAQAKPHWGTTHHPVEDVGIGMTHVRIEFLCPEDLGFSGAALERPGVAAIVGGFAGDDGKRSRHTLMVHVWLEAPGGGTVLRSRFWIGSKLRPYFPAPLAVPAAWLINRRAFRRMLIPRGAPAALAAHCVEEYTNLAGFLPDLYAREASAAASG